MSRQFNFLAFPHEVDVLWPHLRDLGACVFCERDVETSPLRPKLLDLEHVRTAELGVWTVCVTYPSLLDAVVIRHLKETNTHRVATDVSPLIEFSVPNVPTGIPAYGCVDNSRLYYLRGYWGRDGWVAYPAELDRLYDKLVRLLKKQVVKRSADRTRWLSNEVIQRWGTKPSS